MFIYIYIFIHYMSVCHGERPSRIPHLKKHPRFRSSSSPRFSDPHTTKANFGPAAMAPRLEFDGETNGEVDVVAGHGWSWGHGKPAMSGFNMFFSQPRHDHFTARTAALSSHERWPFLEQSQQWKLSDASNTKNKKVILTSISSYFSMVLS